MSDPSIMEGIALLVPRGSRVLDLGCGNGELMAYLQAVRAYFEQTIATDLKGVAA